MRWVVVGGAGFVGRAVCREVGRRGHPVAGLDRNPDPDSTASSSAQLASQSPCDVLVDDVDLPPGRVVLALGNSLPRPVRPWTLVLDNALATARLTAALSGRDVTLLSSVEVYGSAGGPLTEQTRPRLPASGGQIDAWCDRAAVAAQQPCPPHRVAELCQELAALDPTGRWVYALAKVAQEELVRRAVGADRLTVLRCANVLGAGQWRLVGRLVEALADSRAIRLTDTVRSFVSVEELARIVAELTAAGVYNVASGTLALTEVAALVAAELGGGRPPQLVPAPAQDSCGIVDAARLRHALGPLEDVRTAVRRCARESTRPARPMFRPALPVVLPPRPEQPAVVADRVSAALWTGQLRGGRWADRLTDRLREAVGCGDRPLLLTNSGTNALRLAVEAVAGRPAPGEVALCPAYTFHATAEVLRQLGYVVRLVDVEPATWTMDPVALTAALTAAPAAGPVRVVVAVDALGNPADYAALNRVCRRAGVPLVADSAAGLGSRAAGLAVGTQAAAHAFSMSFAKVVSGGGSGGAVVLPAGGPAKSSAGAPPAGSPENWRRSAAMTEISAIVALDNIEALEQVVCRRRQVAAAYEQILAPHSLCPQQVRPDDRHSYVHWVARVPHHIGRDRLAAALADEGVATRAYYEPLAGPAGPPVTALLHRQALALPMSSELSVDDADRVAAAVARTIRRLGRAGDHRPPARPRSSHEDPALTAGATR